MKSIKVKSYNKLIEDIKLDGDTSNWNGKLKKRIVDAIRLAKECRAAAKAAKENGDDESAAWLEQRAEDYEQAAKNWNQDTLDDDTEDQNNGSDSNTNNKGEEAESAEDAAARAQNAANRAKASADAAEKAANEVKEKAEEADKNGTPEDAQKATEAAKNAAESAQKAKNAAEKAQEAADKAKEAAADGTAEEASKAANEAEEAEEQAKDAAKQAMDKSDGSDKSKGAGGEDTVNTDNANQDSAANGGPNSDGSNSDGDSDADSKSDSSSEGDSESEEDGDKSDTESDDSSDGDGDKGKKSKGSSSGSGSDSGDDGGSDDEDDDEPSDEPIKDPFADDEDIPSLSMGSPNGAQPRDPTIDEIIKQLQGLEGEAKRGAIAGLSDLINKKNESLTEAFKKSIREFDDDEWDDLNNETIDRIEKVKKIDTIDNVDGIKAGFKGWSDNAVARQELEDEENQNIQHDILKKRAHEQELDKYGNLETLKDFEIDFENCIRDQVELVMQEYQSYDEINPEYEDEDIIMKADVQKMLPSEVVPSVAIFFDQSSSWTDDDIKKGEQAIATVKKKYVDTGLCKLDLFYFSDIVVTNRNSSALRNGTTAWPDIIRTIASNDPKNVIIMTDSDMNTWNNHGESYTVEGCVWWIWKNGLRAPNLPKQLRGMQHNYECEFH